MISPAGSAPPSSFNFPITESPQKQGNSGTPARAPHLPFRRISLPTAPTLLHRVSVVSIASFDSLPEDGDESPPRTTPAKKPSKPRPISVESPRRRNRTRDSVVKLHDDRQAAKRRKVVDEFYETEKAYVDGLELIYSHFLTPIIASLDAPEPLLNRSALTSIFSNFIDIWNLHRSFLSSLTSLLKPIDIPSVPSLPAVDGSPPNLSPLLLAHFPYLSLYTPFVTAFPSTISALTELVTPPSATRPNPLYNSHFATFLATQEADPHCGKLKLRDWLLTIVQRCPRYLLLIKDLINSTDKDDPEHAQLTAVHTLVSKITLSLNTSLHTHAQTLALLALQRATPNLPFQLITPGRNLVKRGSLLQAERNGAPVEREFLLFSDCIIWLAPAEPSGNSWDWSWSGSGSGASQSSHNTPVKPSVVDRPAMTRTRSKSEAEVSSLKAESESESNTVDRGIVESPSTPVTPQRINNRRSHYHDGPPPPPPNMSKRHASVDDKWVYKGRVELVDLEVVIGSSLEDERRFELLSPEGSFVVYAASEEERDEWTSEIRGAKAQRLISLNVTNPNSTLTSSASTNHVRRALQALPYPPSDDRLATLRASSSVDGVSFSGSTSGFASASASASANHSHHGKFKHSKKEKEKDKDKAKHGLSAERRQKVDHWVPAIWIPDGKTSSCMRCGRMFGWRRRRHHCRLCGRCVCSACSGRTFFVSDANTKDDLSSKPARACDACYETVFPLIDPPEESNSNPQADPDWMEAANEYRGLDTITSLSQLPSWLSMPALPVHRQPQALMAIDLNSSRARDLSLDVEDNPNVIGDDRERRAVRLRAAKSHQRIRSYQQILEDFQEEARAMKRRQQGQQQQKRDMTSVVLAEDAHGSHGHGREDDDKFEGYSAADDDREMEFGHQDHIDDGVFFTPTHSLAPSPVSSPCKHQQRREDTARRSKRFSLPAIALHTTNVTARTTMESGVAEASGIEENVSASSSDLTAVGGSGGGLGHRKSKRFSLILAGRNSVYSEGGMSKSSSEDGGDWGLARGVAAAKLSELLGRKARV